MRWGLDERGLFRAWVSDAWVGAWVGAWALRRLGSLNSN